MLGAGTQANPYLISTPQDLDAVRNNLTAHFELTNDIDMTGYSFKPIGRVHPFFSGHLDGKGYKVINLRIVDNAEYTAFIARSNEGSIIKNLGFENIYVESNNHHVAGVIALNYTTTISNCYVTGTINQTVKSRYYAGGLVGRNYGLIENCYTDCQVTGGDSVGGLIGHVANQLSVINNNYSKSIVTGTKNVGAFFGITEPEPTFSNNYYDSQIAGVANTSKTGVTGKSSADMQTQSTFTGWDFSKVWFMDAYPKLRVFASDIVTPNVETITVATYANPLHSTIIKSIKSTKHTESFLSPISCITTRQISTNKHVETYTLPIHSSVQKYNRTVRNSTQSVDSYISPLHSSIYKESKTIKQLLAFMKPLQAHVDVLIPIDSKVVNAYLSVLVNPSSASHSDNMSRCQYIVNPSSVEVIT